MNHDLGDQPEPPRSRAWSFYFVLIAFVAPFWLSVPVAWAYVLYSLNSGAIWSFPWSRQFLFIFAMTEALFSVYYSLLARSVAGPTSYGPPNPLEIRSAYGRLLKAGLANLPEDGGDEESLNSERPGSPAEPIIELEHDDPRAIDFRATMRTWFCKAPWSSLRLHEVRKWLYWSMFNSDLPEALKQLPRAHRIALDEALDLIQQRVGKKFEDGSNPEVHPIRFTMDRVTVQWRPFASYAIIGVFSWGIKKLYRKKWNVQHASYNGLEYLLRVPEEWDSDSGPHPIVFIHGLGMGLLQYHAVISNMFESFPDRPILIPLQPHISQDFFHPNFLKPMSRHQTADRLAMLLDTLGWAHLDLNSEDYDDVDDKQDETFKSSLPKRRPGVTMISHSNGSYTHAWMLKGYPHIVARSCFVDPVSVCSWEGDVCYNFIYRPAMNGMELLVRYFVGTEVGVANLLQRHFDWVSNSLWYEDIPNARDASKTKFVLGGKDDIVNSPRVKRYLTSHGVRDGLWYDPNGRHGQAFITGSQGHKEIVRWIREGE